MVVKNTGLEFIIGTFDNLAQGQPVALSYGGVTFEVLRLLPHGEIAEEAWVAGNHRGRPRAVRSTAPRGQPRAGG